MLSQPGHQLVLRTDEMFRLMAAWMTAFQKVAPAARLDDPVVVDKPALSPAQIPNLTQVIEAKHLF